jgi:heme-degrading monooxygenase HmoA
MGSLYTLGEWTVIAGREEQFVAAWGELAAWTAANAEGSGWAKLLQDRDDPQRFISFGPWSSDEAIGAWRGHPEFEAHVGRIRRLVTSFVPHTMTVAAQAGPATPDP